MSYSEAVEAVMASDSVLRAAYTGIPDQVPEEPAPMSPKEAGEELDRLATEYMERPGGVDYLEALHAVADDPENLGVVRAYGQG